MKQCPECRRAYSDETLNFCLDDGAALLDGPSSMDEPATAVLSSPEFTSSRSMAQPITTTTRRIDARLFIAAAVVAIAILGGFWGFKYLRTSGPDAVGSIAVLPFENRSGTSDSDYLSDGLADSLIYRLSQLPNLKVSPTSSVMRYKGSASDVSQIAKALNVDAIMSGRLTQIGDSLNISVQLIDARTDRLIWAEQYDRKMSDLLATQREIATAIAEKLQLKLSGASSTGITKKYTDSNEAYQLYMRGRYSFAKRTKDDMLRAIEYFRQAIDIDPKFALAYARIAEAYGSLPAYPYMSPKEAFPEAKRAAQKALEIDPSLSEAHTFLAYSLAIYDWNWPDAEREFKRAIELEPKNASAHFRYGQIYLVPLGRMDINMGATLSWALCAAHQEKDGLTQAKKTYELEPTHPIGRWMLSQAYLSNGNYSDAIALDEKWLETEPTSQFALRDAAIAYAKAGNADKANALIGRLQEMSKTQYVPACRIAAVYAALGQKDKAFNELQKSFEARDWELHRLNFDLYWAGIRDDDRFHELVKKLNLPQ